MRNGKRHFRKEINQVIKEFNLYQEYVNGLARYEIIASLLALIDDDVQLKEQQIIIR